MPVLVDFGFAEKYNLNKDTGEAFRSNLTYGTPEVCMHLFYSRTFIKFLEVLIPGAGEGPFT